MLKVNVSDWPPLIVVLKAPSTYTFVERVEGSPDTSTSTVYDVCESTRGMATPATIVQDRRTNSNRAEGDNAFFLVRECKNRCLKYFTAGYSGG